MQPDFRCGEIWHAVAFAAFVTHSLAAAEPIAAKARKRAGKVPALATVTARPCASERQVF
jgi:hypothetical protein